jgi:cyclic pyranopterin phosphate synthase
MSLIDAFGRQITYVRLSVTDRCDLRCTYCMAEEMEFLPRDQVLSIEEFALLGKVLSELGVTKIRLTGGEPLIRRGIIQLAQALGQLPLLQQLCLTTNGTHLKQHAQALKAAGVNRINISLDSLDADNFRRLTRVGKLQSVLEGIDAAIDARFESIKLNCVALKHYNAHEVNHLVQFALDKKIDISFIEEMPLGKIDDHGRDAEFVSSAELRQSLKKDFTLIPDIQKEHHDGPAKYWRVTNHQSRIGFISPHSENFCGSCNRVRITATGRLLLCLGQENSVDLRKVLRESPAPEAELKQTIINAMQHKPEKHEFNLDEEPQILRFMNMTGG